MAQTVKTLPTMQETWVRSLGGEDPLQKGMATHASTLAWEIPGTEEPGVSVGSQKVRHDWMTNTFTFLQISDRWTTLLFQAREDERNIAQI